MGSLPDPARGLKDDLLKSRFDDLKDLLELALATEMPATLWGPGPGPGLELSDDARDLAVTARGLLDAARLLDGRYHVVITNVPYLARPKQNNTLKDHCARHCPEAKNGLANVFLERCLELSREEAQGVVQIVMPQNWLLLTGYRKQRESLLRRMHWNLLARLRPGASETISGEVVQVVLLIQTHEAAPDGFHLLLADAYCAGKGLDLWLRDKFFERHAKRFQHRPFIWRVWDGLKDGLGVLVNYHKLDNDHHLTLAEKDAARGESA